MPGRMGSSWTEWYPRLPAVSMIAARSCVGCWPIPKVGYILVEHRDRLARFGVGMVDAMLQARGGRLLVIEDNEVDDDLVRDVTEMLTCFCARLYGRRSAANRARQAISAATE